LAGHADPAAVVAAAYERILNRPPDGDERNEGTEFLKRFAGDAAPAEKAVAALCQTLFASAEFRCLY
jgi:hypothetical protein